MLTTLTLTLRLVNIAFCCFHSIAVNSVYKPQFFAFIFVIAGFYSSWRPIGKLFSISCGLIKFRF